MTGKEARRGSGARSSRARLGGALLLLLAACGGTSPAPATPAGPPVQQRQLVVDGQARSYRVYRPPSLDPRRAAPLVVVLHAFGQTGAGIASTTGFDQAADRGRFVVAYPDGVGNNWHAGFCCDPRSTVNDVAFLERLLDQLERDNRIDRTRVYVAGISAGAFMAYRVACDLADRITAIGSVAGSLLPGTCHPSRPVSVIEIHGTADPLVPYGGGAVRPTGAANAPIPPTPTLLARWAEIDGCRGAPSVEDQPPLTTTRWTDCAAATRVVLDTLAGGGHTWFGPGFGVPDGSIDATAVIWRFFRSVPSPR